MNKWALIAITSLGSLAYLMRPMHYTTDLGNGVTIVADKYVNSGDWVYHCKSFYLTKRTPMPFPAQEFIERGEVLPGLILLSPEKETIAKSLIESLIKKEDWYSELQYSFSNINEQDNLQSHLFWLAIEYENTAWIVWLRQSLASTRLGNYYISANPYDPATHRSHERAISESLTSCPRPQ